jgi:hypothetical protein
MSTMPYLKKPFPLVVQFNSFCCGVPDEKPFRDTIHQVLVRANQPKLIAWKLSPMGKEGEYWICFEEKGSFRLLQSELMEAVKQFANQPQDRGGISIDSHLLIDPVRLPKQSTWEKLVFE